MKIRPALFVSAAILATSCVRYAQAPLPLPPRPDMPAFTDAEIRCLEDNVYNRVAGRDMGHRLYIDRLESVIKTTWE